MKGAAVASLKSIILTKGLSGLGHSPYYTLSIAAHAGLTQASVVGLI